MNTIKVRAWDKTRKQMFTSPKWVEFSVNIKGELTAKNYDYAGNEQALEILQYTGLKDKNGIEIYESDVMIMKSKKHGPHNVVVVYDAPEFRMKGNKSIFKDTTLSLGEIIGNIYENPELID